jgi:hypothetical protein
MMDGATGVVWILRKTLCARVGRRWRRVVVDSEVTVFHRLHCRRRRPYLW